MSAGPPSATFTMEFGREYEVERQSWLRTRFLWYTGVVAALWASWFIIWLLVRLIDDPALLLTADSIARNIMRVMIFITYAGAFALVNGRSQFSRPRLVRLVFTLIIGAGLLLFIPPAIAYFRQDASGGGPAEWLTAIFLFHLFACMFLPLTAKESFKPLVPLLIVNAVITIVRDPSLGSILAIVPTPLIGVPGAAICWSRHGRFRRSFTFKALRGRYTEMKRELVDARRLHEALFPPQITQGPIRFAYAYEPMRQIGGDYLYTRQRSVGEHHELSVILLDVTGHGIPAALTVNRLHGELDRIFAEQPEIGPGGVLQLLNKYVHLTLATHSVYVTALCMRVRTDPGELDYASGGHPPAFLRGVDGSIEELTSTALVLGACKDDDFDAEPATLKFGQGDTLVAYTDGAMEARDSGGAFFGIDRLRAMLANATPAIGAGWPETIIAEVDHFRFGPAADDTLIIEITRPLAVNGPLAASAKTIAMASADDV